MKKNIVKDLETIAKTLPVVWEEQNIWKTGKQILKEQPDAIDDKGKKLRPKDKYVKTIRVPVNHLERLKKLYKQRGPQSIEDYTRWAHEQYRIQNPKPKKIQSA